MRECNNFPRFSSFANPSMAQGEYEERGSDYKSEELESFTNSLVDKDGNVVRRHRSRGQAFNLEIDLGKKLK